MLRFLVFQIQEMFENGKPDIVMKTFKKFNIKRTRIIILILKKSLKLRIAVLVMFNKMLVIVLIIDFYSGYKLGSQKPSLSICAHFLTHSVRNGPSVSFGTNVPCI